MTVGTRTHLNVVVIMIAASQESIRYMTGGVSRIQDKQHVMERNITGPRFLTVFSLRLSRGSEQSKARAPGKFPWIFLSGLLIETLIWRSDTRKMRETARKCCSRCS